MKREWIGAALLLAAAALSPASAQEAPDWRAEKCERYRKDWREALRRRGPAGLSAEFITGHEAFLAAGCPTPGDVCPRSREELALANILTIRAMNAGMASTFLPFRCRR